MTGFKPNNFYCLYYNYNMNRTQVILIILLVFIILFVLLIICYKYHAITKKTMHDGVNDNVNNDNVNNDNVNNDNVNNDIDDNYINRLSLVPRMYVNACNKLGITYIIKNINDSQVLIKKNNKSVYLRQLYNTFNNSYSNKLARNKYKTYEIFRKNNIPTPKYKYINNVRDIDAIVTTINIEYPIVIKKINGANGDSVYLNINNNTDAKNILKKFYNKEALIEQFIPGNDYRILFFQGEVIEVINRKKPSIIGNGINTINELVDIKNRYNLSNNLHMHKLVIDDKQLLNYNYNKYSKPRKGESIIVNPLSNFHKGSDLIKIDNNKVHDDNIDLFKKIMKVLNLNYCGIDYLSDDISVSYKKNNAKINEVNSLANIDIHYYLDNKYSIGVAIKILKSYFNL